MSTAEAALPAFFEAVLAQTPHAAEPEPAGRRRTAQVAAAVVAGLVVAIAGLAAIARMTGGQVIETGLPRAMSHVAMRSPASPKSEPVPGGRISAYVASDDVGGLRLAIGTGRRPATAVVVVDPAGPGDPVRKVVRLTRPRQVVLLRDLPGGPAVWSVRTGSAPPVSGWLTLIGVPAAPPPTPWPDPSLPKKPSKAPDAHHGTRSR